MHNNPTDDVEVRYSHIIKVITDWIDTTNLVVVGGRGLGLGVGNRGCIGDKHHIGEATGGGGPCPGFNGLPVFLPGVGKIGEDIHPARTYTDSFFTDHLVGLAGDRIGDAGDLPVFDQNILFFSVEGRGGSDNLRLLD